MRSRAVRLSIGAVAWVAIAAASVFIVHSENQIAGLRAEARAFDRGARETTDALSDLRAAQQAYVAAGQGVNFWVPKVADTAAAIGKGLGALRADATSAAAQTSVAAASASMTAFAEVDARARDYLGSEQPLMAGDVIFTEGGQTAAAAARDVEAARLAEHEATDAAEAQIRKRELASLAGAGGATALLVLLLSVTGPGEAAAARPEPASWPLLTEQDLALATDPLEESFVVRHATPLETAKAAAVAAPAVDPQPAAAPVVVASPAPVASTPSAAAPVAVTPVAPSPILRTAAELCTAFGAARDAAELQTILSRAADAMDASGLVVWLGSAAGADLRPVLTHGYSETVRARLPIVSRSADNAAAAAYRTAEVQLMSSRPGGPNAALVAPIVCADGCIGALSAELRQGDVPDHVQAFAVIVAAQLSGVLAANQANPTDAEEIVEPARRAAASS